MATKITGILLILSFASGIAEQVLFPGNPEQELPQGIAIQDIPCPEDKLLECRDSPAMKSLWIEDACRYYDTLKNCYAQFSFECAESFNQNYFTMIQEMKTQKEIFCKEEVPVCDSKKLEACFAKHIDMRNTDLQNPETFPILCKDFGPFSQCYEQAVVPCYSDPTFQGQSPWENLYEQVKIICLSTPECKFYEMTKCNAMLFEGLSLVSTIPTSKFLTTTCEAYSQYSPCMDPLMFICEKKRINPFPEFLLQAKSTDNFVSRLCKEHVLDLMISADKCYDKTEIQSNVDTTCSNPLMSIMFAGEPNEIQLCREAKNYVECIETLIGTECPDDTNAVKAITAYQEAWILETLSSMIGINCPPMGYAKTTPKPATTTLSFYTGHGIIIPSTGQASKPTTQAPPTRAPKTRAPMTFAPTQSPGKSSSTPSSGGNAPSSEKSGVSDGTNAGEIVTMSRGLVWILLTVFTLKTFL